MAEVYWIRLKSHTDMFTQGYIGYTKRNTAERFKEHCFPSSARETLLYRNLKKHKEDIVVSAICVSTNEYCLDLERKLRPVKNIGWNSAVGGGLPPDSRGSVRSEEAKEATAAKHRGMKRSEETRANMREAAKYREFSLENIRKAIASNTGKPRSEMTKKLISIANTGKEFSEESRAKMSASAKARGQTQAQLDALARARDAKKGAPYWEVSGANLIAASLADKVYLSFLDGKLKAQVAREFSMSRATAKALYDKFQNGWIPEDDVDWLNWRDEFNSKRYID